MKNLDKKVLDKIQISDSIYKEKNKMEKLQMGIERIIRNNPELAKPNTY